MKRYLVNIPIIRKQYDKTKSAKFKGALSIVCNEHGIIYDWRIEFSEVHIDVYTTPSWFEQRGHVNFERRKNLFKALKLEMKERPSQSSNLLVKLGSEQLISLNNFFNNRDQYDSTIKNIVGLIKGNNPGGEAKKPSSAEMVIDSQDSSTRNFVIVIDDLVMKKRIDFESVSINAEEIKFDKYVSLNKDIETAFRYMQKHKTLGGWHSYLMNIKEYCKKFNADIEEATRQIKVARSKYSNAIDRVIIDFPFGLTSKDQFEKSHIYEVHTLRDLIVEAIRKQESTKKWIQMVSDPENFIPLPGEAHRKFDKNYFTYDEEGNMVFLSKDGEDFASNYLDKKYSKIDKWFLSHKRVQYLRLRNENIRLRKENILLKMI